MDDLTPWRPSGRYENAAPREAYRLKVADTWWVVSAKNPARQYRSGPAGGEAAMLNMTPEQPWHRGRAGGIRTFYGKSGHDVGRASTYGRHLKRKQMAARQRRSKLLRTHTDGVT